MELLILRPLCEENCGVTADISTLDFDILLKINEYLDIRNAFLERDIRSQEQQQKRKNKI